MNKIQLNEQLFAAVIEGWKIKKIKKLIADGADVNAIDKDGKTPLHRAALNGHIKIVKFLLANGVNINSVDWSGHTLLHRAAESGYKEGVELLLANEADVNAIDEDGKTPLYHAAYKGHTRIVKALVRAGADINKIVLPSVPFRDLNREPTENNGRTPLHCAALNGHIKIVKFLLANGGNINSVDCGRTLLHRAAESGYKEGVEFLLAEGADANIVDLLKNTPLICAIENYTLNMANARIEAFISISIAEDLIAAGNDNTEIVEALIKARDSINVVKGLVAAGDDNAEIIVKALIKAGADVNIAGRHGRTPLHNATSGDCLKVVNALIDGGADINAKDDELETTPLHNAIYRKNNGIVKALIGAGANVDIVDGYGETPLQLAARIGRTEIVNALIEVKKIKEENKPLYDFLKERNINELASIWEKDQSIRSVLDDQESLKRQYPECAYILINKANKMKKGIFLHNHKSLIDVLSKHYEHNFQTMTLTDVKTFFQEYKDDIILELGEIEMCLTDFINFEDIKERHVPRLELSAFAKTIKGKMLSGNLECPSAEQTQGVSQVPN